MVRGYQRDKLIFTNTTSLRLSNNTIYSFIQTDKLRYQHGDTVKLRIISVQPDNRPYKGRVDNISIRVGLNLLFERETKRSGDA